MPYIWIVEEGEEFLTWEDGLEDDVEELSDLEWALLAGAEEEEE